MEKMDDFISTKESVAKTLKKMQNRKKNSAEDYLPDASLSGKNETHKKAMETIGKQISKAMKNIDKE